MKAGVKMPGFVERAIEHLEKFYEVKTSLRSARGEVVFKDSDLKVKKFILESKVGRKKDKYADLLVAYYKGEVVGFTIMRSGAIYGKNGLAPIVNQANEVEIHMTTYDTELESKSLVNTLLKAYTITRDSCVPSLIEIYSGVSVFYVKMTPKAMEDGKGSFLGVELEVKRRDIQETETKPILSIPFVRVMKEEVRRNLLKIVADIIGVGGVNDIEE